MVYDVIIIGSGSAGLTAAIYTSRARLKTLVVAGSIWGGQLMMTSDVENFPGFKEGVQGFELMTQMRKQAERFGAEMIYDNASSVDFSDKPLKITVTNEVYESKTVIIATGASAKWLGLESERRLRGKGVSACAICDAAFFKDKSVIVVGGGDSAMEEALILSKYVNEVKIVHRRDKLRASKILQERVFKNPKIEVIWNSILLEILGEEIVQGVKLKKVDSDEQVTKSCDGVFIAIGNTPNTDLFRGQLKLDQQGYITANIFNETSIDGVFVAGDIQDYQHRQAIVAAGSGCKAALNAQKYLERL